MQKQRIAQHIIETEELAAEYAGIDVETIRQWIQNGMPRTQYQAYLKPWLDLYLQTDGRPTEQDKQNVLSQYPELATAGQRKPAPGQQTTPGPDSLQSPETPELPADLDPETRRIFEQLLNQ